MIGARKPNTPAKVSAAEARIERMLAAACVATDAVAPACSAPVRAARGNSSLRTMSRISAMPVSMLIGRALRLHILSPLYSFGLCEAVQVTPPSSSSEPTAK